MLADPVAWIQVSHGCVREVPDVAMLQASGFAISSSAQWIGLPLRLPKLSVQAKISSRRPPGGSPHEFPGQISAGHPDFCCPRGKPCCSTTNFKMGKASDAALSQRCQYTQRLTSLLSTGSRFARTSRSVTERHGHRLFASARRRHPQIKDERSLMPACCLRFAFLVFVVYRQGQIPDPQGREAGEEEASQGPRHEAHQVQQVRPLAALRSSIFQLTILPFTDVS